MIDVRINGVQLSPQQVVTLRQAAMAACDLARDQGDAETSARFVEMLHLLRPQSPEVEHRVGAERGPLPGVRWRPEP